MANYVPQAELLIKDSVNYLELIDRRLLGKNIDEAELRKQLATIRKDLGRAITFLEIS